MGFGFGTKGPQALISGDRIHGFTGFSLRRGFSRRMYRLVVVELRIWIVAFESCDSTLQPFVPRA